jgi:hypothetical protein
MPTARRQRRRTIAALATYLGHVNPLNTYWYLSASPELMNLVADRTSVYQQGLRT